MRSTNEADLWRLFNEGNWLLGLREPERVDLHEGQIPEWFQYLIATYNPLQHNPTDAHASREQISQPSEVLVGPICDHARALLFERIGGFDGSSNVLYTEAALEDFAAHLKKTLTSVAAKSVVTTMGALADEGDLLGDTPEAQFESFVTALRSSHVALQVWETFPVLARRVAQLALDWVDSVQEFFGRLASDLPELKMREILPKDAGPLVSVTIVGDRHRGGRQGCLLMFGSGAQLVYKPRAITPEKAFQDLLDWISVQDKRLTLRTYRTLPRGQYGWLEFIPYRSCNNDDEVSDFYFRQGINLALAHVLRCTDLHHENIIADRSDPVLVDLETVLHPSRIEIPETVTALVQTVLATSVRRTHLLPRRSDVSQSFDIGGIGKNSETSRKIEKFTWVDAGHFNMSLQRVVDTMKDAGNVPLVEGHPADPRNYAERVVEGFVDTIEFLQARREDFLAPGGPLDTFADVDVRIILRATETYSHLLFDSFDPDLLQDADDLDEFLSEELSQEHARRPELTPALSCELDDLWRCDVPYFTKSASSRNIYGARGIDLGPLNLTEVWQDIQSSLKEDSPSDLELQVRLIRWALYDHSHKPNYLDAPRFASGFPRDIDNPLMLANDLARALANHAYKIPGRASWVTVTDATDGSFKAKPAGCDLYSGLAGIALALMVVGRACGEDDHIELARAALQEAIDMADCQFEVLPLGAFNGICGLIYALTKAAEFIKPQLLGQATALAKRLEPRLHTEASLDIISGHAGIIATLVALHKANPDDSILKLAKISADHVAKIFTSEPIDSEICNSLKRVDFAHGRAGIGWALCALDQVLDDRRYASLGKDLILEDLRSSPSASIILGADPAGFDPIERTLDKENVAWCSGLLGITLALLKRNISIEHYPSEAVARALVAVDSTRLGSQPLGLCHGSFGNALLGFEVARRFPLQPNATRQRVIEQVVRKVRDWQPRQDLSVALECPGLMTGIAGVAYGLVCLANPDAAPSILTLE